MAKPNRTPAAAAFSPAKAIRHHHAEFTACCEAAWQCRRWAGEYLEAAALYDRAAADAALHLKRALQTKWAAQDASQGVQP